jgi:broad specificity phosphatase PhoE
MSVIMPKRLFVMRHAITELNINNVWTGHLDINIASTSSMPHSRVPHPPSVSNLDFIICSDAARCRQTLALMDTTNTKVIYDHHFIECGYGKYTGLPKSRDVFHRTFYNTPESSKKYIGESRLSGGLRAYKRYLYLLSKHNLQQKSVMILSHKNTLIGFWALHYLNKDYEAKGKSFDPVVRAEDLCSSEMNCVLERHPAPSPFENDKPYELY